MTFWEKLGQFGQHQWLFIVGYAIINWMHAAQTLAPTFIAIKPNFYCQDWLPAPQNVTSVDLQAAVNLSIVNQCTHPITLSSCAPEKWRFDDTQRSQTIYSEYLLICDASWWVPLGTSIYMAGLFLGSFIMGYFSDKYGRYPNTLVCAAVTTIAAIVLPWLRVYWMFLLARFVLAIFMSGLWVVVASYMVESTSPPYRIYFGLLCRTIGWDFGALVSIVLAYFFRGYQSLMIFYACLAVANLWPVFFYRESPLWLLSVGKRKQALQVAKDIAQTNGKQLTDAEVDSLLTAVELETALSIGSSHSNVGFWTLFYYSKLRTILLVNWMHFFASSMIYYAISLGVALLGGNVYLNAGLMYIGDIIMLIPIYIWGKQFPRKTFLTISYALGCALCVLSGGLFAYVEAYEGAVRVIFIITSLCGRFMLSMAFMLNWTYASEVFPTVVRSSAVGSCSAMARVGGVLAPLILPLKSFWAPFPFLIFAAFSGMCAIGCIWTPETRGVPIPQQLGQAEDMWNRRSSARVGGDYGHAVHI